MPDLLLAIAKSLAGVPGLAPVFNPLISLRDDEKSAKANKALLEKISEGHEISREALDEILVGILGIREDNQAIQHQIFAGFYAVLKLILQHQDRFGMLGQQQPPTSATNLDEEVSALVQQDEPLLVSEGLVTVEALRDELVRCFSAEVGTLLAIAEPAGFPKGLMAKEVPPIQAYYKFLGAFDNQTTRQKAQITRAIARKIPGSDLFRTWAAIYASSDN